jgi:hypothetical protein
MRLLTENTTSQQERLERSLVPFTLFLSTIAFLVGRELIAFNPATVNQTFHYHTMLTCNLATDSLFDLAANTLVIVYVVN